MVLVMVGTVLFLVLIRLLNDLKNQRLFHFHFHLAATTHDQEVFSFYPNNSPCNGFEEVLSRYKELVPHIRLAGWCKYFSQIGFPFSFFW